MYKATDIANWFIWRSAVEIDDDENISLLKVLKLLYYSEGCSLALGKGSIFPEKIVAWEHGPVVEEVYRKFRDNPYKLDYDEDLALKVENDKTVSEVLEQVYNIFGAYSAWGLRNKTHNETPWIKATSNGKYLNKEISRDEMVKYFKENYVEE